MDELMKWKSFFEDRYNKYLISTIDHIPFDPLVLQSYDSEMYSEFIKEPDKIIDIMESAVNEYLDGVTLEHKKISIRVDKLPSTIHIGDIRREHINKLVCVEGLIRQTTPVSTRIKSAKFICTSCSNEITIPQEKNKINKPYICPQCRSKRFTMAEEKIYENYQVMVIEEAPENLKGVETPSQIHIMVRDALVDREMSKLNYPGARIRIVGLITDLPADMTKDIETTRRILVIEANNIDYLKVDYEQVVISQKEEKEIKEIASKGDVLAKMVDSFAPQVYGNDNLKLALLLQQFGSTDVSHKGMLIKSGQFHILLIGDTSTGKSQLSTYLKLICPKIGFATCTGASAAGLIGTVVKDELLGGWAWQSGKILLNNNGTVVTDELDKLAPEEQQKLNDVLSSHEVKIDKATIHATFTSKISLVAIANPKKGRFSKYSGNIMEDISISQALLSRFDLIFPIRDYVDKARDEKIICKIVDTFTDVKKTMKTDIEPEFIKKYIIYSKRHFNPELDDNSKKKIVGLYTKLRSSNIQEGSDAIPITARQGDALVRLTLSVARANLCNIAKEEHVEVAYNLMKSFLNETCTDNETGKIDIDTIDSKGMTSSKRNIMDEVMNTLTEAEKERGNPKEGIPTQDIIDYVVSKGHKEWDVEKCITKLYEIGELTYCTPHTLKRLR